MFQNTHYSENFFKLLNVWPKGYLAFPSIDLKGLSQSKGIIIIENVSKKLVVFRVIQEQNCTLNIRCRPVIGILEPKMVQKIEILNESDHASTLSDRIYIEAIEYFNENKIELDSDGKIKLESHVFLNQEFLSKYLDNKSLEFFCLKCYDTNILSLIPMEEQLYKLEKKLQQIESSLEKFRFLVFFKNWAIPLFIPVIVLIFFFHFLTTNLSDDYIKN